MAENGILEGYHREWVKDDAWQLGTKYAKCRQPRCPNPPVAEFNRMFTLDNGRRVPRPYAYCANHLYGRRIENGEVQHNVLVKDAQ